MTSEARPPADIGRRQALWILLAITAAGAALRFYHLSWGTPYYHFHIDEHSVLGPADVLRRDPHEAAMYPKFFMYSPFVMYLINIVRSIYEAVAHPLNLTVPRDEVTYTLMGRAISAAFGTATIPLAYAAAERIAGRVAGLLSAALLACAVLHLRDSHFATTDVAVTFFCVLTLWLALRLVERGDWGSLVGSGLAFAGAILCKYSGAFVLGVIGIAYVMAPGRPASPQPLVRWVRWALRGIVPIGVGMGTFLVLDPLAWQYPAKLRSDIKDWVIDPLTGATKPAWTAQFADVFWPRLYWFTNLLWWSLGPALEIVGLAGVVWLVTRWDKKAALAGVFPILYFMAAGLTTTPFIRYVIPLCPALAIAAGVLSADLMRRPKWRSLALAGTAVTVLTTGLYAAAYMNVFRQPDSRLEASRWLLQHVPADSKILVEPSQNTPPMGLYLTAPDFNRDYVLRGNPNGNAERREYYDLFTMDVYRFLYNPGVSDDMRQRYIDQHLPLADWVVIDDTFLQFYQHLPVSTHRVPKQYYENLFAGRLGFKLVQTFKTYPSLFGITINDDSAELTFRLFDHPRVFIFQRVSS